MPFVPAKCPNCGGTLTIDSTKDAAICEFCNTPFITEKAINNYNLSLNGNLSVETANITINALPNADTLLLRANGFFEDKDYPNALVYYNRVLDIDPLNSEAKRRLSMLKEPQGNNLLVSRKKEILQSGYAVKIFVDGKKIGSIKNGEYAEYKIPLGDHQISVKMALEKSLNFQVTINDPFKAVHLNVKAGWKFEAKASVE